jgi:hypothetical protein
MKKIGGLKKKQIVSAPLCLVILTNFLFDPFSLEMKLFGTKLYFTCILVHEFEKKKKRFIEKLRRRERDSKRLLFSDETRCF